MLSFSEELGVTNTVTKLPWHVPAHGDNRGDMRSSLVPDLDRAMEQIHYSILV